MSRLAFTLLVLFYSTASVALEELSQDAATKWLQRMGEALHNLNYDGVFVYHNGEQLSSMRLIHGYDASGEHERLVSLTGAPREVIRSNEKVICILPDSRSVIVERTDQSRPGFPHLLPNQIQQISDNYRFEIGQQGRVSGLQAQQIHILPRDDYRYSYHLWLDVDSGMLLKAELRDQHELIEQFMFTSLKFSDEFPAANLQSAISKNDFSSYHYQHREQVESVSVATDHWRIDTLPVGFKLQYRQFQIQSQPQRIGLAQNSQPEPIEHRVYSDGLSTVSIFIERLQAGQASMNGDTPLGAINTYSTMVGQTQITVVGEVPRQTVRQIAESVRYQP